MGHEVEEPAPEDSRGTDLGKFLRVWNDFTGKKGGLNI